MRTVLRSGMHVAGLWALAIAQPLFDVLGQAPEFFVAHRADTLDRVILALALALGGPAVFVVTCAIAQAVSARLAAVTAAVVVGGLAGAVAVHIAYQLGASGWTATSMVGAIAAVSAGMASARVAGVRTFLTVLSPAVLAVPAIFLWNGMDRSSAGASAVDASTDLRPVPVVVIVFDELPLVSLMDSQGRINPARFPNFAALAADGVWFRNATAVSDYTRWALPAILTGRYPVKGSEPTPEQHPNTLFSLVGPSHRLEVFESVTALCPERLCARAGGRRLDRLRAIAADLEVVAAHVFLPPAAREGLPDLTENWAGFGADGDEAGGADTDNPPGWQQVWRRASGADPLSNAQAFLDEISADDDPATLYFMHTLVTHRPSRWLPTGQRIARRREAPGLRDGGWAEAEWLVAQHHHGHLVQAGLADGIVGRLRARLEEAGRYDDALVIVTADHGVSFRSGGRVRNFTPDNAPDLAPVPLIVKLPAGGDGPRPGTVDDSNVEAIDVLPTVARVLGADVPWPIDGGAVVGPGVRRPGKRFYYNVATTYARLSPDEIRARRDEAVTRQTGLFGDDAWPAFALPGRRGIVGREVGSFAIGETGIRLAIENSDVFEQIDPRAAELPVQVVGRVRGGFSPEAVRAEIAVALNGYIVATTRTWPGTVRWMVTLPPASLRPGANTLELFVVDPDDPSRLLRNR